LKAKRVLSLTAYRLNAFTASTPRLAAARSATGEYMRNTILLMLPPNENAFLPMGHIPSPPLSLAYLSSSLKAHGFDTELVDLRYQFHQLIAPRIRHDELSFLYDKRRILDYVSQDNTDAPIDSLLSDLLSGLDLDSCRAVGISMGADVSIFEIHMSLLVGAYIVKHRNRNVILGGFNVSYLYAYREQYGELWAAVLKRFKYVLKGAAERSLPEILRATGDQASLPGRVYSENGHVRANPEYAPTVLRPDFDTLPLHYYSNYVDASSSDDAKDNLDMIYRLPPHLYRYVNSSRSKRTNTRRKLVIPYAFNHNCPYRCAFCWESDVDKGNVVLGDVRKVVDDIRYLSDKYQSKYFMFLNNAFNSSPAFADKWCDAIVKEGIEIYWSDCGRFNNITLDRLMAMRESGCQKIVFGLETASRKLSRFIDKRLDLDHSERVLRWCKQAGIRVDLEVIVGLPYESEDEFGETLEYVRRNSEFINYMSINQYYVLPNSLIGRYPDKYGIKIVGSLTYDQILETNRRMFVEGTNNFRVHRYVETNNGRTADEVERDSRRHYLTIRKQQSPWFNEIEREFCRSAANRLTA
jgi:radical SAM superfamily enzyme YgiQ (UPF0313 family)